MNLRCLTIAFAFLFAEGRQSQAARHKAVSRTDRSGSTPAACKHRLLREERAEEMNLPRKPQLDDLQMTCAGRRTLAYHQ